jgi:hypothetical protein
MFAFLAFTAFAMVATPSFAQDVKIPQTVADHEALAKSYKDQAAQFRKTAEEHKQMAEAYAKKNPDSKGGMKNPWNAKMQKHCMMIVKDAEKLATDAEKAADYHTLRAKELQGK